MAGQRNSYGKRSHSRSHSDYSDDGRKKRRNSGRERESFAIGAEDTVYRYLCPGRKIGSIIGRGGEIVKKIRADSKSKIRIGETVNGCDERVVTIYSSSDETNDFDGTDDRVCPSHDALFMVHDRIVADDMSDSEEEPQVTVRLLVPSDQIGCVIGKGGQIVQSIRSDTGAQIRIMKDDHLPPCALASDELVQISGKGPVVRKALFQISSRLHDNPSRSQHMLISAKPPNAYESGGSVMGPTGGAPIMGLAPVMGSYGGYKGENGRWSGSFYSAPRDEPSSKEFSLHLVCPTANIGGVIGKGGSIINQIRQDSGATIKVDTAAADVDCIISISAKEFFENTFSPTIEAALRLQSSCSEKVERDSGLISFTTRLLVPTSRIGCLIGKGGSIITEMRNTTKANIRILSKEDVPKVASEDDEMVQISGDLDVAKDALLQVTSRLRGNLFDREGPVSAFVPVLPYLPMSVDHSDGMKYESREGRRYGREHSYSGGYGGPSDLPTSELYGSYGGLHSGGGSGSAYGGYGGYSSGRTGSSGYSGQSASRRRSYGH